MTVWGELAGGAASCRGVSELTLNGGHVGAGVGAAQRQDVGPGDAALLHVVLAVTDLHSARSAQGKRETKMHKVNSSTLPPPRHPTPDSSPPGSASAVAHPGTRGEHSATRSAS